jgi:alpha-amylase/alpha-mannosidase (GH57 family)
MDRCLELDPGQRPTAKEIVQLLEAMPAGTPSAAEARGAPLRTASLALWRNQLPQQVSTFLPGSPSLTEGEEDLAALGMSTLSNDAEVLEAAADRAERGQEATQQAAPTLRLQDLPPLSDSERLF